MQESMERSSYSKSACFVQQLSNNTQEGQLLQTAVLNRFKGMMQIWSIDANHQQRGTCIPVECLTGVGDGRSLWSMSAGAASSASELMSDALSCCMSSRLAVAGPADSVSKKVAESCSEGSPSITAERSLLNTCTKENQQVSRLSAHLDSKMYRQNECQF